MNPKVRGPGLASEYDVSEADLDTDRDAILRLWSQKETGSVLDEVKLDQFYKNNPAGTGHIFLLNCKSAGRPVGVIGAARRRFIDGDDEINASIIIDLVIEPEHRSLGPGLLLQRTASASMAERSDFVYSFPNPRAVVLRRKLGFDEHRVLYQMVCPTDLSAYIPPLFPKWFGKLAGALYGACVGLRWWASARSSVRQTELNERFAEDLWATRRSSDHIVGDRSLSFLKWRLADRPNKEVVFFCIEDNDGNTVGYIAYIVSPEKKVNIVDFWCAPKQSLSLLMATFLRQMKTCGQISVALEIDGLCKHDVRTLRSIGFFRREVSGIYVTYGNADNSANFYGRLRISRYDGDS